MSKNFELLRQAGWRQEYFEDLPPSPDPQYSPSITSGQTKRFPAKNDQISALVRRIFLDSHGSHVRTVMFAGATRGAGGSWTCVHTAKTLAHYVSGNVCVVDANLEAPALHRHFFVGHSSAKGISDTIFESSVSKQCASQIENTNLWFLPAGNRCKQVLALADKSLLESHLRELRGEFDYVLIDAPAVTASPLAVSIGRASHGAVLVMDSSGIAPNLLLRARKQLEKANVPLFGVVLNQRAPALPSVLDRLIK